MTESEELVPVTSEEEIQVGWLLAERPCIDCPTDEHRYLVLVREPTSSTHEAFDGVAWHPASGAWCFQIAPLPRCLRGTPPDEQCFYLIDVIKSGHLFRVVTRRSNERPDQEALDRAQGRRDALPRPVPVR